MMIRTDSNLLAQILISKCSRVEVLSSLGFHDCKIRQISGFKLNPCDGPLETAVNIHVMVLENRRMFERYFYPLPFFATSAA